MPGKKGKKKKSNQLPRGRFWGEAGVDSVPLDAILRGGVCGIGTVCWSCVIDTGGVDNDLVTGEGIGAPFAETLLAPLLVPLLR